MIRILAFFLVVLCCSCVTKDKEIAELFPEEQLNAEYAYNGYLLYSDSAKVRVQLNYPGLPRYNEEDEDLTEFPQGMNVEFFDNNQRPSSWLVSKYALRNDRKGNMVARDSVVLYNADGDKLETSELWWDEKEEEIYTEKFVRITQPAKKDTSYGYGFRAQQDFTEFEIGKFSGLGTLPIK